MDFASVLLLDQVIAAHLMKNAVCIQTQFIKILSELHDYVINKHPSYDSAKKDRENYTNIMNHLVGWAFMVEKGAVQKAKLVKFKDDAQADFDNTLTAQYNRAYDNFFDVTEFKAYYNKKNKNNKKGRKTEETTTDNEVMRMIQGIFPDNNSKIKREQRHQQATKPPGQNSPNVENDKKKSRMRD